MSIILGDVSLNPNLVWLDQMHSPVQQAVRRTLGGRLRVNYQQISGGQPITLEATRDQGWFTFEQVNEIKALAVQAGAEYDLIIGQQAFNVMFRHHEPEAFTYRPLIERAVPLPGDYFTGVIKLIVV